MSTSASAYGCAYTAYACGNMSAASRWQRKAALRFRQELAHRLAAVYGAFDLRQGDRVKVVRHERIPSPIKRQWLADAEGVVVMVDEGLASVLVELDSGRASWVPGECVQSLEPPDDWYEAHAHWVCDLCGSIQTETLCEVCSG